MRMWYLIIPPIVVVVSLALLVWYLSRKGNDPAVLDKLAQEEAEAKKVSFLSTKKLSLGILEKMTQRFKIGTLRMHNAMGSLSQSLRKKRERVAELAALQKTVKAEEASREISEPKRRFFDRFRKDSSVGQAENESLVEKERASETTQRSEHEAGEKRSPEIRAAVPAEKSHDSAWRAPKEADENPRPMVSDQVAEPEIRRKRGRQSISQEEALIESIALNPKDFTAFEALGDYYMSVNNIKDAKECYRQVLKLRPVHRMVKIKIRRLEKIISEKA